MPGTRLNITDEQRDALDAQPESQPPLKLPRDRVGRIVLDEGLLARQRRKQPVPGRRAK